MGALPPDTRCGWCGRVEGWCGRTGHHTKVFIVDWKGGPVDPPVPLCKFGERERVGSLYIPNGCLYGSRCRAEVMYDAMCAIGLLRVLKTTEVLRLIADVL